MRSSRGAQPLVGDALLALELVEPVERRLRRLETGDRLVGAPLALAVDPQPPHERPERQPLPDERHRDHADRDEDEQLAVGDLLGQRERGGERDRAAHPRPADDEPLAPVRAGVEAARGGYEAGQQRRRADPQQAHADDDRADDRDVEQQLPGLAGLADAVEHALELQAEQDEQRRVQAEDERLPERDRAQAGVGVEHLVRMPTEPDAGDHCRQHAGGADLLRPDVGAVGEQDRQEDRQRDVAQAPLQALSDPADGEPDGDPARRRADELPQRVVQRERRRAGRADGDPVGHQRRRVVEHRLRLDRDLDPLGHAEAAERRRRRDRVGRAEDRAEDERLRPGQPERRVRDDGDRAHRHEHERERQRGDLTGRGAQLLRRGGEARGVQQRRQEQQEDRLRARARRRAGRARSRSPRRR